MEKPHRFWPTLLFGLLLTLIVLAAVLRIAFGVIGASDDFKVFCAHQIEHALHPLLPEAVVEVGSTKITGMASVELESIVIRSGRKLSAMLSFATAKVEPRFLSLLVGDALQFDANADMVDHGGQLRLSVFLPKGVLGSWRTDADPEGRVKVSGSMRGMDAEGVAALLQAEHKGPNFRLQKGVLSGQFTVVKEVSHKTVGHKFGDANLRLENSHWLLSPDGTKFLDIVSMSVDLSARDFDITLRSPVAFIERTGQARISGSIRLPKLADHDSKWALDVQIDGNSDLGHSLARLLRCKAPPANAAHFQVLGPTHAPDCP